MVCCNTPWFAATPRGLLQNLHHFSAKSINFITPSQLVLTIKAPIL
jgi:hypothetical protein